MRDTIPKMSRQDFEFIADTIKSWELPTLMEGATWAPAVVDAFRQSFAEHFARQLIHTNPAFKESRFIARASSSVVNDDDPHWATTAGRVCTCGAEFANNKEFRQHHDEMTR